MKNTLMVGYDLNSPGQNYQPLIDAIKAEGKWWHYLDSNWIVVTTKTAAQLRDSLGSLIDANDELLIIDVTSDSWASKGFPDKANSWLKQNVSGAVRHG